MSSYRENRMWLTLKKSSRGEAKTQELSLEANVKEETWSYILEAG